MPSSTDLADTRRIVFARVNALETVLRRLAHRVELLEARRVAEAQSDPPEASSAAGKVVVRSVSRRAIGSQRAIGARAHREDLEEAWRD
jgi:hypothetical protein